MNSREKILTALNHQATDRVPRDLGGTTATSINIIAYQNLIKYLGIKEHAKLFSDRVRIGDLSEDILTCFKSDTRMIMPGGSFGVGEPNGDGTYTTVMVWYELCRCLP
jgi:hypothetical protein